MQQPDTTPPLVSQPKAVKKQPRKKVSSNLSHETVKNIMKLNSSRISKNAVVIMRKYVELYIAEASKKMGVACELTKHKTIRKEEAASILKDGVKNFKMTDEDILSIDQFPDKSIKDGPPFSTIRHMIKLHSGGKIVSKNATLYMATACLKYINTVVKEADEIKNVSKLQTLLPEHIEHVCTHMR